jgi:hypothetical protein
VEVYSGDMTDRELDPFEKQTYLHDQIDRNMVYSNNPLFTKEEKSKTFLYRDRKKMELMSERVKLAREYFKTITLNGKN